ncbi:hypothetical protein PMAYCL1PPCAC_12723 [Pristionchus mayeri]|uniref:Hut-1 n=1 Tax=Pristionchus mayeri TaxID=1317129 RepID=A0AAN5C988_9BILA|nr:hypothetical protein PMAYCL1PPCAC_12723 [Pristionchus mayeri]
MGKKEKSDDTAPLIKSNQTLSWPEWIVHEAKLAGQFMFCAGGILLCYFYFGIQQEVVVQGKYENGDIFTYTQALVFFMCVANTIFAYFMRSKHCKDNVPTPTYAICAASYLAAMMFSNMALQFLPYPTQVLAKSCKPIPVLVFGALFAGKSYHFRKYLFVIMIVAGVALFMYKDKKSKAEEGGFGWGEILLLLSLTCDGTTTAIQDRIKKSYHRSSESMMLFMNFFSSLYLLLGLIATGELVGFIAFVQKYPKVFWELLLLSIAGCGGQYFIFKTINEFSPLTCSIVTTTRKLFTIIISVIFMNHPLSERQIMGMVSCIILLFIIRCPGCCLHWSRSRCR